MFDNFGCAYCLRLFSLAVFFSADQIAEKLQDMSGGKETVAKVVAMLHRDWEQEVGACVVLFTQPATGSSVVRSAKQ